ncbi:MAG: hypothetical protein FWF76_06955 [Oscillospiraceae bacterium]|nr:hypothetical protein [Oscillospiraceae bacterium]
MKKIVRLIMILVVLSATVIACSDSIESSQSGTPGRSESTGGAGENSEELNFPLFAFPYEFEAVDIFGNTVTNESLGEKRAFFVYHWATWCNPCVQSMPTLSQMLEDYGDIVGFIGLLGDFDNVGGAVNIVESAGITEDFIIIDASEASDLVSDIATGFFPTTALLTANDIFPDSLTGRVGEAQSEMLGLVRVGSVD